MNFLKYICSYICILGFFSCQHQETIHKSFPVSVDVSPELIPINEIFKIGDIYKSDDYIILRNIDRNAEFLFYVYSYPEFNYLYSFCPYGNGPEEFLMPTVIKNTPQNFFSFRDHATDRWATYQLTDNAACLVHSFHFKPDETHFFWEMNYVDEGLYLLKRCNSKSSYRELWNLASKTQLSSISNTFDLEKEMGNEYYTEFDDYWISVHSNKMAFAYFFINRIEFGEINRDKLEITNHVGANNPPRFYTFKKGRSGGKYEYNVDYNTVYYESMACSENYVYALFANKPWGDQEKEHSSIIEIYDWQGTPQKQIKLEQAISSFVVDKNERILYAINSDQYEDRILKYDIGEE